VEASTLRWILIIVGLVIVGSIFLFGNPDKKRKPKASRKEKKAKVAKNARRENPERREPTLEPTGEDVRERELEGLDDQGDPEFQRELNIASVEPIKRPKPPPRRTKPAGPPPEKISTLYLLASDNHVITGAELLQATVSTGMEFGDMGIFHRVPEGSEQPVFSMANIAKPGYFERDEWNTFETNGVALFMALPGPLSGLDAWDSMLATARRMGEILQAELLDSERSPFTRQREAQVREEMREYDRGKKA